MANYSLDWPDKPNEITEDNFFLQSFWILKESKPFIKVRAGDANFNAVKAFFDGDFKNGLEILLNNRLYPAVQALRIMHEEGINLWSCYKYELFKALNLFRK